MDLHRFSAFDYMKLIVGSALVAAAFQFFTFPNSIVSGGVTGIAQIIHLLTRIPVGVLSILINIPIFYLGWRHRLGTRRLVLALCVMALISVLIDALALTGLVVTDEPMLGAVYGGVLNGAGYGLIYTTSTTGGGTDIVAMIINKYRTVSYGKILIYSDFVIIGSALLVGMGISAVIYGYVMTAVVGYTVDMIMAGNQQSSQVFIVTHDYEKMAQAIVDNVHRGVTLIDSQGWYSKKESKIVMVVCRKRETSMILKFVKTIDPEAFMTVGSVMGVYGKGFQTIGKG